MISDLFLALRALGRRPGLLMVSVMSLALGIGVNVAVFSVINGALLRPLPYRDPDRLVVVWHTFGAGQSLPAIHPMDYRDYKARAKSFEDFTLIGGFETLMQTKDDPELVRVGNVAWNFFPFLGVEPALGRQFRPEEDLPQGAKVVWLDHDLWMRHFGGDPGVIGRMVNLEGVPNEIVGVLPEGFELYLPSEAFFVKRPQLWKPARIDFSRLPPRNWTAWTGLGRLKPGVTLAQGREEMRSLGAELRREVPEFQAGDLRVDVTPLATDVVKSVQGGLWALMGAVGLVLLIACVNVARLLLARGFSREGEFRMRAALGAGRTALARPVLAEALIITGAGAVAGVLMAQASLQVIRSLEAAAVPRLHTVSLDWRVMLFAFGAAFLAAVLSALAPGLRASQASATPGSASDRVIGGARGRRLQDRLVMGQVALAVVVVVGAGFMIQSFRALSEVSLGFNPDHLLTLRLALPRAQYKDAASVREFFRQAETRIKGLPGVTSMSGVSLLPLAGAGPLQTFAYDEETARNWESATADYRRVSPGFFRSIGATLVEGREFEEADAPPTGELKRVVIDTALARRAFPGQSALGRRIQLEPGNAPEAFSEVIGVVAPLSLQGLVDSSMPQIYETGALSRNRINLLVRSTSRPEDLAAAVKRELLALSPDLAIQDVRPMEAIVGEALAPSRLALGLMSVFGFVSITLAGLGIYSALAYSVSQRMRELGVRMALGETPSGLRAHVLSQGLRLSGVSLLLGVGIAAFLGASARVSLFGVRWTDPAAYSGAILLLALVAMAAAWIPAARAARVDPLKALRHE